jgi:alanine racemase
MMYDTSGNMLFRPAWATVDLSALRENYALLKGHLPVGTGIMAMVKADAYGHGAVEVSHVLAASGVSALGVATVEEGMELRAAGIETSILVMCGLMGAGSPASVRMIEESLTPVIHSSGVIESLEKAAAAAGKDVGVHLKIDTGMSRLGVRPEMLDPVLGRLRACEHIRVEGVMTHLADADEDDSAADQIDIFEGCIERIERALGHIRIWHVANSVAIMKGRPVCVRGAAECWARPGLALYGECETDHPLREKVRPVMGIESRVMLLKSAPAGTRVSYGGTYTLSRKSRLAVVPIGYADGYPWRASGKASVLVRGQRVPVVGRVTMDMIVLDATDIDGVAVGDAVVLLGKQGEAEIRLRDLAAWAGTIPYEILCGVSKRMPRIYKDRDT